jgi:hypothetical protein
MEVSGTTLSAWRGPESQFATLLPVEGDPWVKVQRVGGSGGVHVDLDVDDIERSARWAETLGATVVDELDDVIVLRSPGGFPFCVTSWDDAERPSDQVRTGQAELLDQVCLDIPAGVYEAESAFWAALTGWELLRGALAEFEFLPRPTGLPLRLVLQRLGEVTGEVRGHLDAACVDVAAATARHQSLGAVVVDRRRLWTVMHDPVGRPYCLTGRDPETGLRRP